MAAPAIRPVPAPATRLPARSTPAVRRIVADWRRLTGGGRGDDGRRTLVAVSGGADSSGVLLALAAGVSKPSELLVVAHIVHDLREPEETHADRAAVAALAEGLGLRFASREVRARAAGGNLESGARRVRYSALAELAREHGCGYVATAHHADDQLESVLMGLLRGAGPGGLAGVAESRALGRGVRLIRPALRVGREELRGLCRGAGVEWREDLTNADTARLRASLRHGVIPLLEKLRPKAAARAARSAVLLRDADALVGERARTLLKRIESPVAVETGAGTPRFTRMEVRWARDLLREERVVVLGATLRLAAAGLRGGAGRDRLGAKTLEPVIRAIRSKGTDPKVFTLRGLEARVTARHVSLRCTDA